MKQPITKDKRRDCRYPYRTSVCYARLGLLESGALPPVTVCTTMDISESGLCVDLRKTTLKKGAIVSIRMPLQDMKTSVPVLSEVRWIDETAPGRFKAGLMFIS